MDQDVTMALAVIRQELAILKSALGVHRAADAEAVIRRLVYAVENQGDNQQDDESVIAQLVTAAQNQALDIAILRRDVAVLLGITAATHPVTTHGSLSYAPLQIAVTTAENLVAYGSLAGSPYAITATIVPVSPSQGGLTASPFGIAGTTTQKILEAQGKVTAGVYGIAGVVTIGAVT